MLDKETGAGAYQIAGGGNGGVLVTAELIKFFDVLNWISFAWAAAESIRNIFYVFGSVPAKAIPIAGVIANIINFATTVSSFALACKDQVVVALFTFIFAVMVIASALLAFGTLGIGGAIVGAVLGISAQFLSLHLSKLAGSC